MRTGAAWHRLDAAPRAFSAVARELALDDAVTCALRTKRNREACDCDESAHRCLKRAAGRRVDQHIQHSMKQRDGTHAAAALALNSAVINNEPATIETAQPTTSAGPIADMPSANANSGRCQVAQTAATISLAAGAGGDGCTVIIGSHGRR